MHYNRKTSCNVNILGLNPSTAEIGKMARRLGGAGWRVTYIDDKQRSFLGFMSIKEVNRAHALLNACISFTQWKSTYSTLY